MPDTPLTDQTLQRLARYAEGNGMTAGDIQLIETTEAVYTVTGWLRLSPRLDIQNRHYAGPARGKGQQVAATYAALAAEVEQYRRQFTGGSEWRTEAIAELKATPGYGWGHAGGTVVLPQQKKIFVATENCPACQGRQRLTCEQCQGRTQIPCPYCHEHRQEPCPHCFGRGVDPVNPEQPCPTCRGTRFTPCRYCHGVGTLPCPNCQARGGVTCTACAGAGQLTEETTVAGAADIDFDLDRHAQLPSGMLRAFDRMGLAALAKGHADIELIEPDAKDTAADKARLVLKARLPYAEIKLRIAGKSGIVSAFGKQGKLFGVPPFLDRSLQPWRMRLKQTASSGAGLDKVLEARAMNEALRLRLSASRTPDDLRRIYPVGLSAAAATEIWRNMGAALGKLTRRTRLIAAGASFAASLLLFGGFLLTPLHGWLPPQAALAADLLLPVLAMALSWLALAESSRWRLTRHFPTLPVQRQSHIGALGYGLMAAIVLTYAALWWWGRLL